MIRLNVQLDMTMLCNTRFYLALALEWLECFYAHVFVGMRLYKIKLSPQQRPRRVADNLFKLFFYLFIYLGAVFLSQPQSEILDEG